MDLNNTFCVVCGTPFHATRIGHVYCSNKCAQKRHRDRSLADSVNDKNIEPPKEDLKKLYVSPEKQGYCPMTCKRWNICNMRNGIEYEYVTSGSGRWRGLRGCPEE